MGGVGVEGGAAAAQQQLSMASSCQAMERGCSFKIRILCLTSTLFQASYSGSTHSKPMPILDGSQVENIRQAHQAVRQPNNP